MVRSQSINFDHLLDILETFVVFQLLRTISAEVARQGDILPRDETLKGYQAGSDKA